MTSRSRCRPAFTAPSISRSRAFTWPTWSSASAVLSCCWSAHCSALRPRAPQRRLDRHRLLALRGCSMDRRLRKHLSEPVFCCDDRPSTARQRKPRTCRPRRAWDWLLAFALAIGPVAWLAHWRSHMRSPLMGCYPHRAPLASPLWTHMRGPERNRGYRADARRRWHRTRNAWRSAWPQPASPSKLPESGEGRTRFSPFAQSLAALSSVIALISSMRLPWRWCRHAHGADVSDMQHYRAAVAGSLLAACAIRDRRRRSAAVPPTAGTAWALRCGAHYIPMSPVKRHRGSAAGRIEEAQLYLAGVIANTPDRSAELGSCILP